MAAPCFIPAVCDDGGGKKLKRQRWELAALSYSVRSYKRRKEVSFVLAGSMRLESVPWQVQVLGEERDGACLPCSAVVR